MCTQHLINYLDCCEIFVSGNAFVECLACIGKCLISNGCASPPVPQSLCREGWGRGGVEGGIIIFLCFSINLTTAPCYVLQLFAFSFDQFHNSQPSSRTLENGKVL